MKREAKKEHRINLWGPVVLRQTHEVCLFSGRQTGGFAFGFPLSPQKGVPPKTTHPYPTKPRKLSTSAASNALFFTSASSTPDSDAECAPPQTLFSRMVQGATVGVSWLLGGMSVTWTAAFSPTGKKSRGIFKLDPANLRVVG